MSRASVLINLLVRQLVTAVTSTGLYSNDHPQVIRLREELLEILTKGLETRPELLLMVVGDELVVDGLVIEEGLHVERIVSLLKGWDIGHLKFMHGVTQDEIDRLIASLAGKSVYARTTAHVSVGRVELKDSLQKLPKWQSDGLKVSSSDIATVKHFYAGVQGDCLLDTGGISEMVSGFITLVRNQKHPMLALAPLRNLDEYTFSHSINVCILNIAQGTALGIEGAALHEIGIAGLLHDIGKLFVPRDILSKPGKLNDEEWEQMRLHPVNGARYLLQTPGIPKLAAVVAFEHHMKLDFSGYPKVQQRWTQHIASQITALSDFFDALRTKRAYRGSVELQEVTTMLLEGIGTDFHPTLARNFLLILSRITPDDDAPALFPQSSDTEPPGLC